MTLIVCAFRCAGTLTLNQLTINNEAINPLEGHTLDEVSSQKQFHAFNAPVLHLTFIDIICLDAGT